MAIQQTLKKLGLNDKEIKAYLALLKSGKTKPSVLARLTKLNRATLYNVARGLIAKGIIAEDASSKVLYLVPLPVKNLEKILEDAKRELREKEALVKDAERELSLITAKSIYTVPKIRFIEEENLEKFLYDNLLKWQKEVIASDGVWWGFQHHSFVENYEKWIEATWKTKECQHEHYTGKVFTDVSSKIEQKIKGRYPASKRNVRSLEGVNFSASIWVSGSYLVMIQTKEHPNYLFEIHDEMLAHNMREVLRKLWNESEKQG